MENILIVANDLPDYDRASGGKRLCISNGLYDLN